MIDLYGNSIENNYIDPKKIILLDLNYTLISNSGKCYGRYPERIYQQRYEKELIDMVKDNYVILITARPGVYKDATLEHIEERTGFVPDESYWNTGVGNKGMSPPNLKEYWLNNEIFPKHGDDPQKYYAIESNSQTRAMYKRLGIHSNRKQEIMAKYK